MTKPIILPLHKVATVGAIINGRKELVPVGQAERIPLPMAPGPELEGRRRKATDEARQANEQSRQREEERRDGLFLTTRARISSQSQPPEKREMAKTYNRKVVRRNRMATVARAMEKRAREGVLEAQAKLPELEKVLQKADQELDQELARLEA